MFLFYFNFFSNNFVLFFILSSFTADFTRLAVYNKKNKTQNFNISFPFFNRSYVRANEASNF